MKEVFELIDQRFSDYVAELQGWVSQPSVSSNGEGIGSMAQFVCDRIREVGGSVQVFQKDDDYPIIYGEIQGSSERALLFYNHYDVKPPGLEKNWDFPPFEAKLSKGKMYGRGVADDKGCLLSRIQAVEAFQEIAGRLPVNVKFLVEGEEEIGSPNLHQFVESHKDLLRADACIWEYAAKGSQGHPTAALGNKGDCYVKLSSKGTKRDFHSMYGGVFPNAAWRLVWALSTLKDIDENLLIDGFYEDVRPLSPEEEGMLGRMPPLEELQGEAGISELLGGLKGMDVKRRLYGYPTCTICSMASGPSGPGVLTVLPATATAKVDFRLVVEQNPDDILRKLRVHLNDHGFDDIEIEALSTSLPVKTSITHPFVQIVMKAASHVYKRTLMVQPTSPGGGPRWMFSEWTDMPIVGLGVGHAGSAIHAPNENILLEDYREGIKHIAAILGLS